MSGPDRRPLLQCPQPGLGGVLERAQHAGDVDERAALEAPFGRRAGRLALEVDDHEVPPGPEHLAEVVVAVHADAAGVDAVGPHGAERIEQLGLGRDDRLGVGACVALGSARPCAARAATSGAPASASTGRSSAGRAW